MIQSRLYYSLIQCFTNSRKSILYIVYMFIYHIPYFDCMHNIKILVKNIHNIYSVYAAYYKFFRILF